MRRARGPRRVRLACPQARAPARGSRLRILAAVSLGLWLVLLLLPWQPWRCKERLEARAVDAAPNVDFTVLIPARNEAENIKETLSALSEAAPGASVIVLDDQSDDGTADVVRASPHPDVRVIAGSAPPGGWAGKLWALEQGFGHVATSRVLLLDADILLEPGMPEALLDKAAAGYALVSVLAEPCWRGPWARWLLPAFVYFFKLIYPFALANRPAGPVAAAAGGVVLADCAALRDIGAFSAWRDAIIDDCTLARHMKRSRHRCFIGLTRGARSLRGQGRRSIVSMVARSAYVQLRESPWILLGATALLLLAYAVPVAAVAFAGPTRWLGIAAWIALATAYLPALLYYRRNPFAAILLPAAAMFYLGMTWYSALRHLSGTRSSWKGREYKKEVREEQ
ncbi:MAG: glycosyltransferase [Gammaproteobacteria bacterium]|nr:glycosyltransferase [Gammaproteobacteria bacterium]